MAGGRELRAFVSLKMADDETDGGERMEVSPEPSLAPQPPTSVSLHPLAPFVLSPKSLPPLLGGCGALLSWRCWGRGVLELKDPPSRHKVSGYLHTFLPAKSTECNDCHLLVSTCLDTHVSVLKWEEFVLFAVGAELRLEKPFFGRRIADPSCG